MGAVCLRSLRTANQKRDGTNSHDVFSADKGCERRGPDGGCLRGAMRVCGMADESSDPYASCMRKSDDLDARRVQGDEEDGGDANETTQRGRDRVDVSKNSERSVESKNQFPCIIYYSDFVVQLRLSSRNSSTFPAINSSRTADSVAGPSIV